MQKRSQALVMACAGDVFCASLLYGWALALHVTDILPQKEQEKAGGQENIADM